jgi:mono/diheme cytochrome c family protein
LSQPGLRRHKNITINIAILEIVIIFFTKKGMWHSWSMRIIQDDSGICWRNFMRNAYFYVVVGLALFGLISPAVAENGQGKALYNDKCAACHGTNGNGQGSLASVLHPNPTDFTNPSFWQGNVNRKITNSVVNGHSPMPAFALRPSQIQAIIDYMSQTFK